MSKKEQITTLADHGLWKEGGMKVGNSIFRFWAKVYDLPSDYGIENGRISKLSLHRNGELVCNYDRGWDIEPVDDDTKMAVAVMLYSYQ